MKSSAKSIALILAAVMAGAMALKADNAPAENTIYDSNPDHLWNRLNEALFVRTAQDGKKYGLDELDILYWARTTNLLAGVSHQKALSVLDEFINSHGENLVQDPLKRALLQRDLWELFDWSMMNDNSDHVPERTELQKRLAILIRRLALTTNEIATLPDNYTESETTNVPDLPHGPFDTNGDWVVVRDSNNLLTVPSHVASFGGRSAFSVLLHVPGGRPAALSYLDQLSSFARLYHLWVYQTNRDALFNTNEPSEALGLNPAIPQFPMNTEWALVRRMLTIDTDGKIRATPIIESIQMRRYLNPESRIFEEQSSTNIQRFFEFHMNRRQAGRLRAIGHDERGFPFVHFMGMGIDLFEDAYKNSANEPQTFDSTNLTTTTLRTCFTCHSAPGIFSVNSYTRFLSFGDFSSQRPASFTTNDTGRDTEEAIDWKRRQFSWGLLQGLWSQ